MDSDENFYSIIDLDDSSPRSMLTDLHMHKFMELVPNLHMQSTLLLQSLINIEQNPSGRQFVQILFRGPINLGHWICVWYNGDVLHIFDSLNEGLQDDHKKYISRLFSNSDMLNIVYEIVQIQKQPYNCGLFAIAFATSIAFGICPCNVIFEENLMRIHLKKVFIENTLQMFPISNYNVSINNIETISKHNRAYMNEHFGNQVENIIDLRSYRKMFENSILCNQSEKIIDKINLVEDDDTAMEWEISKCAMISNVNCENKINENARKKVYYNNLSKEKKIQRVERKRQIRQMQRENKIDIEKHKKRKRKKTKRISKFNSRTKVKES